MPRSQLSRATALGCLLAILLAASALASGALVKVNSIILRADGSFQPRALPHRGFAPIDFHGYFDVAAKGGGKPVALQEAVIDFDRDGRLNAAGLPVCVPEQVANVGVREARELCRGAIVGTGRIEALVDLGGASVPASSALTFFNGPSREGEPTVILHARTNAPATQTFAILVPIERRPGAFRYRASMSFPQIASGLGSITRVEATLGRRFTVGGQTRSYLSAHCTDGILHTHGRFTFADGTVVDGSVEKACSVR
ncbi:MAG TPA: hypothetical protein VFI03_06185 [Solirubrobacterales bacterium]|nr:hypothetical protein [Solirubrobacterales bacterium]